MKKRVIGLVLVTAMFAMAGCAKSKETAANVSENGEVKLCDYNNLAVEKPVYKITDDIVTSEIDSILAQYAEYNVVDRAAKSGDYVTAKFTGTADGETILDFSTDEWENMIGDESFGAEFDKKMIGLSAGSKINFTVTYEDDFFDSELAGKKVTYKGTVSAVKEEVIPKATDKALLEELGCESYDEFKEAVKASLEEQYEQQSESEVREALMQKVIENSEFVKYSDELYASSKASVEANYEANMQMFGCSTLQEFYDLLQISEEDIENEIKNMVYRTIVVDTISKKENLSVSDDEYKEGVQTLADENGYDSADALEEEYGEAELRSLLLEEKMLDLLEKSATITEVEATDNDETT